MGARGKRLESEETRERLMGGKEPGERGENQGRVCGRERVCREWLGRRGEEGRTSSGASSMGSLVP